MEERIRLEEARAVAATELSNDTTEDRFAKLGKDSELEDALLELKTKVLPPASFLRRARLNQRTRALRRKVARAMLEAWWRGDNPKHRALLPRLTRDGGQGDPSFALGMTDRSG